MKATAEFVWVGQWGVVRWFEKLFLCQTKLQWRLRLCRGCDNQVELNNNKILKVGVHGIKSLPIKPADYNAPH